MIQNPIERNLVATQNRAFSEVVQIQNPDGTPVALTGFSAKCQIRKNVESGVVFEMSTENGRIGIDAGSGTITIQTLGSITLPAQGRYVYDIMLYPTASVGLADTIQRGLFIIQKPVTI
ncbi:MAG: hypothetical protein J0L94_01195 [Rhodothermia bacterium]|nr:hypothetical protein [Rhodothermia bacterium]